MKRGPAPGVYLWRGRRNGVTPEGFIALLRAECLKARAEA